MLGEGPWLLKVNVCGVLGWKPLEPYVHETTQPQRACSRTDQGDNHCS